MSIIRPCCYFAPHKPLALPGILIRLLGLFQESGLVRDLFQGNEFACSGYRHLIASALSLIFDTFHKCV